MLFNFFNFLLHLAHSTFKENSFHIAYFRPRKKQKHKGVVDYESQDAFQQEMCFLNLTNLCVCGVFRAIFHAQTDTPVNIILWDCYNIWDSVVFLCKETLRLVSYLGKTNSKLEYGMRKAAPWQLLS